jgi:hypothetical protein
MEDELSLLDEINATLPAADFQAEYYPGGMISITMSITAEMAGQVKALAEEQGWPEADAYVAMLASGIGALKEARAREMLAEDSEPARNQLDLLVKQMRQMETQYAVMKFRTWNFLQAYQASAMSRGALESRANGLAQVVSRLRAENDALRLQLARTAVPNTAIDPVPRDVRETEPPDQPNIRNALRKIFKGPQPPSPTSRRRP